MKRYHTINGTLDKRFKRRKFVTGVQMIGARPKKPEGFGADNALNIASAGAAGFAAGGPAGAAIGIIGAGVGEAVNQAEENQQFRKDLQQRKIDVTAGLNTGTLDANQLPVQPGQAKKGLYASGTEGIEVEKDELIFTKTATGKYVLKADFQGGKTHNKGGEDYQAADGDIIFPGKDRKKVMKAYKSQDFPKLESMRMSLPKDTEAGKAEDGLDNDKNRPNTVVTKYATGTEKQKHRLRNLITLASNPHNDTVVNMRMIKSYIKTHRLDVNKIVNGRVFKKDSGDYDYASALRESSGPTASGQWPNRGDEGEIFIGSSHPDYAQEKQKAKDEGRTFREHKGRTLALNDDEANEYFERDKSITLRKDKADTIAAAKADAATIAGDAEARINAFNKAKPVKTKEQEDQERIDRFDAKQSAKIAERDEKDPAEAERLKVLHAEIQAAQARGETPGALSNTDEAGRVITTDAQKGALGVIPKKPVTHEDLVGPPGTFWQDLGQRIRDAATVSEPREIDVERSAGGSGNITYYKPRQNVGFQGSPIEELPIYDVNPDGTTSETGTPPVVPGSTTKGTGRGGYVDPRKSREVFAAPVGLDNGGGLIGPELQAALPTPIMNLQEQVNPEMSPEDAKKYKKFLKKEGRRGRRESRQEDLKAFWAQNGDSLKQGAGYAAQGFAALSNMFPGEAEIQESTPVKLSRLKYKDTSERLRQKSKINERVQASNARNVSGGNVQNYLANRKQAGLSNLQTQQDINVTEYQRSLGIANQNINIGNRESIYNNRLTQRDQEVNASNRAARSNIIRAGVGQLGQLGAQIGQDSRAQLNQEELRKAISSGMFNADGSFDAN